MTVPVGPAGMVIARMSDAEKDRLRVALRERVAPDASGHVAFEAVANAVKGRKPR